MNHSVEEKKVVGKFKIETPKIIWIDEFIALKSKTYLFKCNDENTNKLKGICKSYSKHIKFEEYKKCMDGKKYQQECDNYFHCSLNHEMFLQKTKKSTLSHFDDKRCFAKLIKSKPWE